MNELSNEEILKLIYTNPGSFNYITSWSGLTGNNLLNNFEQDGLYIYLIQKKIIIFYEK